MIVAEIFTTGAINKTNETFQPIAAARGVPALVFSLSRERKMPMIYEDSLIAIMEDSIIFKHYYFPTGKSKIVRLTDIKNITVEKSTIWNGKWRIQGTGNFKTWYPRDNRRFQRDRIFFVHLKNRWMDIGFTVEDPGQVEKVLREKKLLSAG